MWTHLCQKKNMNKNKAWTMLVAKFELECLIFIYRNSKFVVICKNADSECWYVVYWTHTKDKPSNFSYITLAILPYIIKITPTILPFSVLWNLLSWCCHQTSFTLVISNTKNTKSSFVLFLFCFVCLFGWFFHIPWELLQLKYVPFGRYCGNHK